MSGKENLVEISMIGPLMHQLVLSDHHQSRALPNELLDLIIKRCCRPTLAASCLVTTEFRSIAITYLYEAPFTRDVIDPHQREDGDAGPRVHARISMLCRTIANNSRLAHLVREFSCCAWSGYLLGAPDMELVLPHLLNLTTATALYTVTQVHLFISLCPSTRLRTVHIMVSGFSMGDGVEQWLASQKDIRDLTIWRPCDGVGGLGSQTFENLERLEAGIDIARAILPTTTSIRRFVSTPLPTEEIAEIGELLRSHCPAVQDLKLCVSNPESVYVKLTSEALAVTAIRGLPCLQNLRVIMYGRINTTTLLGVIETVAQTCPSMRLVRWEARGRMTHGAPFRVYSCALTSGTWTIVQSVSR
ncbi:hypothetical protein FRB93_008790 [Tulasnella sp. JGI-2019a]|nr:hypothetical protein FRB93_008790 [Tulasnella sp. JGI-2019a]